MAIVAIKEQCSSILQAWFHFQAEHKDAQERENYDPAFRLPRTLTISS